MRFGQQEQKTRDREGLRKWYMSNRIMCLCVCVFLVRVFFNYFLFLYCVCHSVEWHSSSSIRIVVLFRFIYCVAFCLAISMLPIYLLFVCFVTVFIENMKRYQVSMNVHLWCGEYVQRKSKRCECICNSYEHIIQHRTEEPKQRKWRNRKTNPFRFIICQRHRSPHI